MIMNAKPPTALPTAALFVLVRAFSSGGEGWGFVVEVVVVAAGWVEVVGGAMRSVTEVSDVA